MVARPPVRLVIEPMGLDDLPAVQAIEAASFSAPWPAHAYQSELESNRMAHYLVARLGGRVVAYALVMPRSFAADVPILGPLFAMLDTLSWNGRPLRGDPRWFVMGQVCVADGYRGSGIFDGLYRTMAERYGADFDFTVTEVAARNTRSLRAHQRVGFQAVHVYPDDTTGEEWHVIALDLRRPLPSTPRR